MTTITLDIPDQVVENLGIGTSISYDRLIMKTIGKDFISPDLKFTSYEKLSEEDKKLYDEVDGLDRNKFTNI